MAKSKQKKIQHFVPQCYLKQWLDPTAPDSKLHDPFVWRFDKDGSNRKAKSPKNIFWENDMYTVVREDGARDLYLEDGLAKLESEYDSIYRTGIVPRSPITDEEAAYLFSFVAMAQIRTQSFRDRQRSFFQEIRQHADEIMAGMAEGREPATGNLQASGGVLTYDDVCELERYPIQGLGRHAFEAIVENYSRMAIAMLVTDSQPGFVTTDKPVVWFNPELRSMPAIFRAPALGQRAIEVTMPLSPRHCLYISHDHTLTGYRDIPLALVDALNFRHIAHAKAHFVCNSRTPRDCWFPPRDANGGAS